MFNYTREQLNQLYKNLPVDIKELMCAEETNDAILKILDDNQVPDEQYSMISNLIRNTLFGLLPPGEFVSALKKEVGLDKDLAKKIGQEINRFIFFPVKESLNSLYKIETPSEQEMLSTVQKETASVPEPPTEKSLKSDAYREPLE